MTIKELDNIIDLYTDTSAKLNTNEKELLHLATHMQRILAMAYAYTGKPLVDRKSVRLAIEAAAKPFYKERTQR